MKRKAGSELIRKYKNPRIQQLQGELSKLPHIQQQIQANRAAAVLVRQARMSAMPLQRASPTDRGFVDTAVTSYVADTTGTLTLMATIAQGTSVNQRVGKKIMYASIQIRGRVFSGTACTTTDTAFIIVYDRRPTGALPAITDVLVSASAGSMNNDDNSGRFQIVRRQDHTLVGNTTTPATGKECFSVDDFIKFRRPAVYKAGAAGTIGDIEEGALYLVTIGVTAAGTGAATFSMGWRIRFTEN